MSYKKGKKDWVRRYPLSKCLARDDKKITLAQSPSFFFIPVLFLPASLMLSSIFSQTRGTPRGYFVLCYVMFYVMYNDVFYINEFEYLLMMVWATYMFQMWKRRDLAGLRREEVCQREITTKNNNIIGSESSLCARVCRSVAVDWTAERHFLAKMTFCKENQGTSEFFFRLISESTFTRKINVFSHF